MAKYIGEFLGTCILALAVSLSITGKFPVPTPVIAGLALGMCVYTFGAVSGTHINPAITIALASIGKITVKDAAIYIVAQFAGAGAAMAIAGTLATRANVGGADGGGVILAEALGAFLLATGVVSVVLANAPGEASGIVIGGSLLLGISIAAPASNGVLNPAVALAIGSVSASYIIGPVIGAVAAMLLYRHVLKP
jgi:glycerol uptake facilitator-like aquaporin